jgi:hypothetical protein
MLFGHLAVSALEHRYLKAEIAPVMAAAVFPDAVDKVLHYVIGRTDTGRLWGHSLLVAAVTTGLILSIWGRQNAASWALGYLSHLVCDIGSVVPWLYPFMSYDFPVSEGFVTTLWDSLAHVPRMILEVALTGWALAALWPRAAQLRDRWHLIRASHRKTATNSGD